MYLREENPRKIRQADLVIGLASYQEADSIAYPVQQADLGLRRYFPDMSAVIVNADNHSPDGTEQVFLNTVTETPTLYITTPPDTPGKGYNLENLLRKAFDLNARVIVCVDADLLSITPEWIKYLVEPILDGGDFANPVYARHKYDGTITKNICYPLIYGVFGRNIRQPIGGDFAMSGAFAGHLIKQPWHVTTMEYGVDIFMTMNAITGGFRICETGLGAKVHKPSAPKLGPMFLQVVNTAFLTIINHLDIWRSHTTLEQPPLYGLRRMDPAQELAVDRTAVDRQAREAFAASREVLETVLPKARFETLAPQFAPGGEIRIDADPWCGLVYEMIAAFARSETREPVVEALKGLYFARVLTFMNETWDWTTEQAEAAIVEQAERFRVRRDELRSMLEAS